MDKVSCKYCGIVERGHNCPYKRQRRKEYSKEADAFRNTTRWQRKREEIKQRDRYLCKVCEANLYNTISTLNWDKLEVHHITKLTDDYNKRLDNDNLITLCAYHHRMADKGEIPNDVLLKLIYPPQ